MGSNSKKRPGKKERQAYNGNGGDKNRVNPASSPTRPADDRKKSLC